MSLEVVFISFSTYVEDGFVRTFGLNDLSQLGRTGNSTSISTISGLSSVTRLSSGEAHTLAISSTFPNCSCKWIKDQNLFGWGWNSYEQLGLDSNTASVVNQPSQINVSFPQLIQAGYLHSLVSNGK